MRMQGLLVKWDEDRGFGFIKCRDSGVEIFVHATAFPRDGRRPRIGDPLMFEIVTSTDGRKRAHTAIFDAPLGRADFTLAPIAKPPPFRAPAPASPRTTGPRRERHREDHRHRESSGFAFKSLVGGVLVGATAFGYHKFAEPGAMAVDRPHGNSIAPSIAPGSPADNASSGYRCDGREHCAQMSSCAEATWFVRRCPNTKMDGDRDGIPCEQQLCG